MILKMAACFPKESSNHKKLTIIWGSVAFRRVMGQEEVACTRVWRWDDYCGYKKDRKVETQSFSAPEATGVCQSGAHFRKKVFKTQAILNSGLSEFGKLSFGFQKTCLGLVWSTPSPSEPELRLYRGI